MNFFQYIIETFGPIWNEFNECKIFNLTILKHTYLMFSLFFHVLNDLRCFLNEIIMYNNYHIVDDE